MWPARSLLAEFFQSLYAIYGALQLSLLVLWAGTSSIRTTASVPTAVLTFAASLVLPLLSYAEHDRSVRPSTLLNVYLFTTLLFDAAHARTLWLRGTSHSIAVVTVVTVVIKIGLLLLEMVEKRRILLPKHAAMSPPEASAGLFNRLFFVWLNGLFRRGFSSYLTVDDLHILDKHLSSQYLEHVLRSAWSKGKSSTITSI